MSRIDLVQEGRATEGAQEVFDKIQRNGARVINLYRMLAYNPEVMRDFLKLGNTLLARTELEPRLRELIILRVASVTGSRYEWTQHYTLALQIGVTVEQTEEIDEWNGSEVFSPVDRAALRYADTLVRNEKVSDDIFRELRRFMADKVIVELTAAIGYWTMVGRFLEALQVDIDSQSVSSAEDLFGGKTQS
jgi:alkylhydroperoxidase family enzyme